ncbi:MAG: alpha/beta hydrolase [Legionellaceae bacterium]|nr:alpha/beta hydrolase [Legionellaceae bacterium]
MPKFFKNTIQNPEFYIVSFTYNPELPYILFIHGGPGLNSAILEYLIENEEVFNTLNCNIILYDQRGCGRSPHSNTIVLHKHNIEDLHQIITHVSRTHKLTIACLVGHSYGAKLLYDYYEKYDAQYPGVFISTADSIITPRLNNLLLDLNYLKKNHPDKYQEVYEKIDTLNFNSLWEISEQLAPVFHENKDRVYFYWANLSYMNKVKEIQAKMEISPNNDVFMSVRKDLYSDHDNYSVAIDDLKIPKLWINGFHDFVMNGSSSSLSHNSKMQTFFYSSHYPHIEEDKKFCELLNEFTKSI